MVDDLDGDSAAFGLGEGARGVAVQTIPGLLVDLGLERFAQPVIGVFCPEEIGVADEKAFLVIVGVDEPAGDGVGFVTDHLSGLRLEDVDALDEDAELIARHGFDLDVGFAENDKEIALAGIFKILCLPSSSSCQWWVGSS